MKKASKNKKVARKSSTYKKVALRIDETPELQPYREIILYNWAEGEAHLKWALTAPVAEVVEQSEAIRRTGLFDPPRRSTKSTYTGPTSWSPFQWTK